MYKKINILGASQGASFELFLDSQTTVAPALWPHPLRAWLLAGLAFEKYTIFLAESVDTPNTDLK